MVKNIENFISYITTLPEKRVFFYLKIFFLILSCLLIIGIIILLFVTDWYQKRFWADISALKKVPKKESKTIRILKKIKKRLENEKEIEYKIAIVEASKLLEKILEKKGFRGKTLLDQLEKAGPDILPLEMLDKLLEAYQIKNNILYDPDFRLDLTKAKMTISTFEEIITSLIS